MLDFFADKPFAFVMVLCLCNIPGIIPGLVLVALARRYNLRNPFINRGEDNASI